MMENKFNFSIGSDLEYEDLIADIGYENQLVALLTQEEGFDNMKIIIYPPSKSYTWNFSLKDFEEIILKAKRRLWELRKLPEDI
jgi:hypothetical protein